MLVIHQKYNLLLNLQEHIHLEQFLLQLLQLYQKMYKVQQEHLQELTKLMKKETNQTKNI